MWRIHQFIHRFIPIWGHSVRWNLPWNLWLIVGYTLNSLPVLQTIKHSTPPNRQFEVTTKPMMNVFGLWEEARLPVENPSIFVPQRKVPAEATRVLLLIYWDKPVKEKPWTEICTNSTSHTKLNLKPHVFMLIKWLWDHPIITSGETLVTF